MLTSELMFWHRHAVMLREMREREPARVDWFAKLEYATMLELDRRDPGDHSPAINYAK